ncbi:MAG: homoserine dehydrogenase [Candidatus Omnitrophota bacterium]|nr:MAG: homoserine dehydrogenase [Candidatus Omnitrophota bacterium]
MQTVNIGLIGFGTIGKGVVKILCNKQALLSEKLGVNLALKFVCDQDITTSRGVSLEKDILTTDVSKVLCDPQIQVVIELIGGIQPAKDFILKALENKKYVITANKALLAECGDEIFAAAYANGVDVYFEASVGGGIPVIKALREGLISNKVKSIYSIINGTSNYILSMMSQQGCDFKTSLKQAQDKGYAEKDPDLDINGLDSAHKIAILSRMCFRQKIEFKDIFVQGISNIALDDIRYAEELEFKIKLLAIAKQNEEYLDVRVHPAFLPKKHLLSNVEGVFNAVFINTDLAGEMLFYGRGAGELPTASAVVSDFCDIVKRLSLPQALDQQDVDLKARIKKVSTITDISTRYYIRFLAVDEPGVLAKIANILGRLRISIHSVMQKGRRQSGVPIVMMTHKAKEADVQEALIQMNSLNVIKAAPVVIRIEDGE